MLVPAAGDWACFGLARKPGRPDTARMPREPDLAGITIVTKPTDDLTDRDRAVMSALFDIAYRDANHPYLAKSLTTLRFAAIAMQNDTPAGFSLGDMRIMDLLRLPQQTVTLAGICCIDPRFRRRGLFGAIERAAITGAGIVPSGRVLSAGRMAHPVSFHVMNPATRIPRYGTAPTSWQRAVAQAIADAYGVPKFDQETFVCHGSGQPIGYPIIEMDVEPEEWRIFEHVNRDRGDSLLGLTWSPDAPEGWL